MVVFDLDGTLLEAESSWGTLNRAFGHDNCDSMALFQRGDIDYLEFMRRDIAGWPKPLHIDRVREALSGWVFRAGAPEVVAASRQRGLVVAILSGGVDVLAEEVAKALEIDHVLVNEMVTDHRGFVTGDVRMRVDPLRKELALEELCRTVAIDPKACLALGDSEMDASLLRAAGLGVLLGDAAQGEALGLHAVSELGELLDLMNRVPPRGVS